MHSYFILPSLQNRVVQNVNTGATFRKKSTSNTFHDWCFLLFLLDFQHYRDVFHGGAGSKHHTQQILQHKFGRESLWFTEQKLWGATGSSSSQTDMNQSVRRGAQPPPPCPPCPPVHHVHPHRPSVIGAEPNQDICCSGLRVVYLPIRHILPPSVVVGRNWTCDVGGVSVDWTVSPRRHTSPASCQNKSWTLNGGKGHGVTAHFH